MEKDKIEDLNLKETQSKIMLSFIKKIILTSSSMLNNKFYFSERISFHRDCIILDYENNHPISDKQDSLETLVTGIYTSYFKAIGETCDYLYSQPLLDDSGFENRVKYDMHMLYKEGVLKNQFSAINKNYRTKISNDEIIPCANTIQCYDPDTDTEYSICPVVYNKKHYENDVEEIYHEVNYYFDHLGFFSREKYLEENSTTIFISSYDSLMKDLSSNEKYCSILEDLIVSGLFDEVFLYLQKEKDYLFDKLSSCDNEIIDLIRHKIYSYLEQKEISLKLDSTFIETDKPFKERRKRI